MHDDGWDGYDGGFSPTPEDFELPGWEGLVNEVFDGLVGRFRFSANRIEGRLDLIPRVFRLPQQITECAWAPTMAEELRRYLERRAACRGRLARMVLGAVFNGRVAVNLMLTARVCLFDFIGKLLRRWIRGPWDKD